jgi:hypothetical protein
MAVAVELSYHGPGATLDNYHQILEQLGGVQPEGPHPDPGCLFHWITEIGGGFRVTDVWRSQEQFEQFAQDRIGPIGQQLGVPEPQVKFIEVANYLTPGS